MNDPTNPDYYKHPYPFEVIDLIERELTEEEFRGYCLGNELKYRLRAGLKTADPEQDILKALWYHKKRVDN